MGFYIFYQIYHDELEYSYIGSTTNFKNRKSYHKSICNNSNYKAYNLKLYQTIRENGSWDAWNMVPIDQGSYDDKMSAHIQEEKLRIQYNGNLNSNVCSTGLNPTDVDYKKDYYIANADRYKDYQKKYNIANSDHYKDYQKQYRLDNDEHIKDYQKQYRLRKIEERQKILNENNLNI